MPSVPAWWWPSRPPVSYVPGRAGPDHGTLRPCGCHIDPTVFGHADDEHEALAGAA